MDILSKQNIEKQDLSIFLRDLSDDVNINLKHMIEDMNKKDEVENIKKKGKNGKGKPMKKKDIIINIPEYKTSSSLENLSKRSKK